MALSVVQAQETESTATGQTSTSVNITTTAGNLLVAVVREGSNNTDSPTMTDSASQSWTRVTIVTISGIAMEEAMFYMANSASVSSVTVNWSTSGGVKNTAIVIYEISGAATSNVFDASVNSSANSSVTSLTSGSLTTTNANDILLYGVSPNGAGGAETAGSGYTLPANSTSTNGRLGMEYKIVSAIQSSVTTSLSWATAIFGATGIFASFKAASAVTINIDLTDPHDGQIPTSPFLSLMTEYADESHAFIAPPPIINAFDEEWAQFSTQNNYGNQQNPDDNPNNQIFVIQSFEQDNGNQISNQIWLSQLSTYEDNDNSPIVIIAPTSAWEGDTNNQIPNSSYVHLEYADDPSNQIFVNQSFDTDADQQQSYALNYAQVGFDPSEESHNPIVIFVPTLAFDEDQQQLQWTPSAAYIDAANHEDFAIIVTITPGPTTLPWIVTWLKSSSTRRGGL